MGCRCALCGRAVSKTTEHHLRPRSERKRLRKRLSKEQLQETVPLCDACHRTVHAVLAEKELARRYDSVEKLRAHPELQKWIQWVRKRPEGRVKVRRPRREDGRGRGAQTPP